MQGRWSLTEPIFRGGPAEGASGAAERRRALAELLLERYGIVTREQVLAEGVKGGFAILYDTFCNLETLGICRRGYFIEGMGGAQFALPGAVERLREGDRTHEGARAHTLTGAPRDPISDRSIVLAAADPAQPYGAALPWPKREGLAGRPDRVNRVARVAGAYVVLVRDEPALYVERGGRGLVTLAGESAGQRRTPGMGRTPRARRSRRSRGPSAQGGWASSRSSASTAGRRSPRASPRSSSSSDSIPARAG